MKPTICFGEIMARLSSPGRLRLRQTMPGMLEVSFAGAEANAAVTIAALGGRVEMVSALPDNELAQACLANLRAMNVGGRYLRLQEGGRMGLFFVETGVGLRAGSVLYDRDYSVFGLTPAADYDWAGICASAGWFHTSGITSAVSALAAGAALAAVRAARAAGVTVSCDINHRRKLWRWDAAQPPANLSRRVLGELLPEVDIVIGNGADLAALTGISTLGNAGSVDEVKAVARATARKFPQLRLVAVTMREGISATYHRWGALLYRPDDDVCFLAPEKAGKYEPREITQIVDRLGTGDAFAGALIFALQTPELSDPEKALGFAVAASCLAHSTRGDFGCYSRQEVESLMNGNNGGAVSR